MLELLLIAGIQQKFEFRFFNIYKSKSLGTPKLDYIGDV